MKQSKEKEELDDVMENGLNLSHAKLIGIARAAVESHESLLLLHAKARQCEKKVSVGYCHP